MSKSKKSSLAAIVGMKTVQSRYLTPNEIGGPRRVKRFERALQLAGVILQGEYVVPASGARITKGVYTTILSQMGALREGSATNSERSQRARRRAGIIFITGDKGRGSGDGLPRGIWRRKGIFIEPLFWITSKRPNYTPRLRFETTSVKVFKRTIKGHMSSSVYRAIKTSK